MKKLLTDYLFYKDDWATIYCGDCLEIMPLLDPESVDLVVTDPPYPDAHLEYGYVDIDFLNNFACRQFIFWSAKSDFILTYSAIHIWDKLMGVGSQYERIFERNGKKDFEVYRACPIQNQTCARLVQDVFTGHPSQKPFKLIRALIAKQKNDGIIFDPFLGSGTTCVAAKNLNRKSIGIEINPKYCEIATSRLKTECSVIKKLTNKVMVQRKGFFDLGVKK
ncbi:MAG: site-specific DNA-methyltransferase [Thermodesulfobacteriota bacterium]|jgi:site-specific DNA-methyltransferase (adenine-specific)